MLDRSIATSSERTMPTANPTCQTHSQSKDNFWTTHPGSGADGASLDQTEVIVAVLSKGPVGPSDGLTWLGNRSDWIKATCNADGTLLQVKRCRDSFLELPFMKEMLI